MDPCRHKTWQILDFRPYWYRVIDEPQKYCSCPWSYCTSGIRKMTLTWMIGNETFGIFYIYQFVMLEDFDLDTEDLFSSRIRRKNCLGGCPFDSLVYMSTPNCQKDSLLLLLLPSVNQTKSFWSKYLYFIWVYSSWWQHWHCRVEPGWEILRNVFLNFVNFPYLILGRVT